MRYITTTYDYRDRLVNITLSSNSNLNNLGEVPLEKMMRTLDGFKKSSAMMKKSDEIKFLFMQVSIVFTKSFV